MTGRIVLQTPSKGQWVKIGEVTKPWFAFFRGHTSLYAVMEQVQEDGMRKYKEVYICSWGDSIRVTAQPEVANIS